VSGGGRAPGAAYEVGSSVTVRALHRMPVEGPEGELHAHEYRIEAVAGRGELDEHGMVCDLDRLRAALEEMAGVLRDRDLEAIRPFWAGAVTVEVLARWAHGQLGPRLRAAGAETLSVRVWETPADFAGYGAPLP
jgi:6-pyruvoyltetrahydropterin/6-carboxytetrahydropterin synthase